MKIQVTQADDMTAAYIELNSRAIKQSVELTPDVIVDCDEFDCVSWDRVAFAQPHTSASGHREQGPCAY